MSQFNDIKAAVLNRLRTLQAKPEMTINLLNVAEPLNDAAFSQDEVMDKP